MSTEETSRPSIGTWPARGVEEMEKKSRARWVAVENPQVYIYLQYISSQFYSCEPLPQPLLVSVEEQPTILWQTLSTRKVKPSSQPASSCEVNSHTIDSMRGNSNANNYNMNPAIPKYSFRHTVTQIDKQTHWYSILRHTLRHKASSSPYSQELRIHIPSIGLVYGRLNLHGSGHPDLMDRPKAGKQPCTIWPSPSVALVFLAEVVMWSRCDYRCLFNSRRCSSSSSRWTGQRNRVT